MLHFVVHFLACHHCLTASIFSDIAGTLSGTFKHLKDLAGAVWRAIKRLTTYVTAIFQHVGGAWWDLHRAFDTLTSGLEHLANGTYGLGKWLIHTLVPKWAQHAISTAINYAVTNVKALANSALKFAKGVKTWASNAIKTVEKTLTKALNAVRTLANDAKHWISHAGKDLFNLVMHPERLVAWIVPSLVTPLMRWILAHLESISAAVLRSFFANIGKFAKDIESAFARIF